MAQKKLREKEEKLQGPLSTEELQAPAMAAKEALDGSELAAQGCKQGTMVCKGSQRHSGGGFILRAQEVMDHWLSSW